MALATVDTMRFSGNPAQTGPLLLAVMVGAAIARIRLDCALVPAPSVPLTIKVTVLVPGTAY